MAVDIFARTVALASLGNSSGDSYTKAEIDKMFGEAGTVQVEAVDVLPTENIRENVIYLVPNGSSGENYYDECMYINGKWEVIGTTEIDLSNYYTKDEVDNRSIVNITLPKSTFEGNSGNIAREDYQAFLPLLQFLYTKCKGTSGDRFIKLPLVNINTARDISGWTDFDNGQLFIVDESYIKISNDIYVSLDGISKFDRSGVAKHFSLSITGNIENDNITSIKSVTINKSTIPVANKKYVDDSKPIIYLNAKTSDIFKEEVNTKLLPYISDPSVDLTKYLVYLYGPFTAQFDKQMKYINGTLMEISSLTQTKVTLKELVSDISYSRGDASSQMSRSNMFISIEFKDGKSTSVSNFSSGAYFPNILDTNVNYSSPYMPKYDGSPATKKYVDDAVAASGGDANKIYYYKMDARYDKTDTSEETLQMFNEIAEKWRNGEKPLLIVQSYIGIEQYEWIGIASPLHGTSANNYLIFKYPSVYSAQQGSYDFWGDVLITCAVNNTTDNVINSVKISQKSQFYTVRYDMGSSHNTNRVLTTDNTSSYTPIEDYNPATKKYVDGSITSAIAGVTQFSLVPVDTLPTENIRTDAIYAIPSDNPQEQDVRIEYVYINDSWEKLGNTKIDLSNYYTKEEIDTKDFTANAVIDGGTF